MGQLNGALQRNSVRTDVLRHACSAHGIAQHTYRTYLPTNSIFSGIAKALCRNLLALHEAMCHC